VRIAVVGAGVVGMSTAAALLDAGHQVTTYESGSIMGARSAGSTRIFRLAHVDPDLVRLAQRARLGFGRWCERAGRPMLRATECVITGTDMADRASAMAAAGADYELVEAGSGRLRLPVRDEPAAALIDLGGGVVDVDAVRGFLTERAGSTVVHDPVHRLAITPGGGVRVTGAGGHGEYDALALAAGASTPHLAAQVGIHTPTLVGHHVRFTFRVEASGVEAAAWQSWIDKPATGFGTYQHQTGPGRWAVGGNVDPALTAWEVGEDEAFRHSRHAAVDYARTRLVVDPTILESLYCTTMPGAGDGVHTRRNGPVVALYGDNLMKMAPVLGEALADAVTEAGCSGPG
jgi:sarcosine oxidase